MKKYVNLEVEVKFFEVADVITSSGDGPYSYGDTEKPFGATNVDNWGWN